VGTVVPPGGHLVGTVVGTVEGTLVGTEEGPVVVARSGHHGGGHRGGTTD